MTMAFKDDNKRKYIADGAEEEAQEAPLKKQNAIATDDDDNEDDNRDDDNDNDDNDS
jgi:hypothetical protein